MVKKKEFIPTHLTAQDQRTIESSIHDSKVHKLVMKLAAKDVDLLKAQRDLIEANIKLASQHQSDLVAIYQQKAQAHVKSMSEIKTRYGVSEKEQFGFDPLSGEVKIT